MKKIHNINITQEKNASLASVLLITDSKINQLEQLLTYLINNNLISTNTNINTIKNLPNILLYNQEEGSLKIKVVRQLIEEASYSNINQDIRVFVILNAHQSSRPAQNALLKVVEEPPPNSLIILVTPNPKQILSTIQSRCLNVYTSQNNKIKLNTIPQEILTTCQGFLGETDFTLNKAIEISEQYKKREDALVFVEQTINCLHAQLDTLSDNKQLDNAIYSLEEFLKAYRDLQNNYNTQLTLENHLFNIASALSNNK